MKHAEIITRLQQATGPDRELDIAINDAIGRDNKFHCDAGYTSSIDAALTLVPDGYVFSVDRNYDGTGCANICKGDFDLVESHRAKASTPAIALCIASMKAREA